MQDDQTNQPIDTVKAAENSADSTDNLTLSGSSTADPSVQPDSPSDEKKITESTGSEAVEETSAPTTDNESPQTEPDSNLPETPGQPENSNLPSDSTLDPIKKEALQKLEPLVSELDLNPEEKYRALMMIIQATDNKDLVNEAYKAADKIEDSKARAQALLNIINEIDYFKSKESVNQ